LPRYPHWGSPVDDILDFSKIKTGKLTLESTEFDLDRTLQEILRMMAVPAHEEGLESLYENRADLLGSVLGIPGCLTVLGDKR